MSMTRSITGYPPRGPRMGAGTYHLPGLSVRGGGQSFPWADLPSGNALHAWDFTNNSARWNSNKLSALANTPGWTFTRASTGYAQTSAGVLVPFASGELRRTDKGVLIEGARTNTQTSTNLNPSATTNISLVDTGTGGSIAIVDDSAELAALGLTGNVLRIIGGTNIAYANFAGGAATDVVHVCSAYVRGGAGRIMYSSGGALTYTFTASTPYIRRVAPATAPGAVARTMMIGADAGETLYVTLHVMEAGAFVSSPIVVAGASATRAADVLTVPVSGIDYPLSLYAEFERVVDTAGSEEYLAVYATNNNNRARIGCSGSDLGFVQTQSASADQGIVSATGAITLASTTKVAARVAADDMNVARGGVIGMADTTVTVPSAPNGISFGVGLSNYSYGYLRRAALFNRALSDAELTALTL